MVAEARTRYGDVTTWLFTPDADPPNPDRIGWWWRRSRERAGIDARWRLHDLRHWSATEGIASGQDVRTVANRLRHADPARKCR
jgi:integrase